MKWLNLISPAARQHLRGWTITRDALDRLKDSRVYRPDVLALCRAPGLEPWILGTAAEVASACGTSEEVEAALVPLLDHASPFVRKGAILGLRRNASPASWERIQRIAAADPSAEVRRAAVEALEEYGPEGDAAEEQL